MGDGEGRKQKKPDELRLIKTRGACMDVAPALSSLDLERMSTLKLVLLDMTLLAPGRARGFFFLFIFSFFFFHPSLVCFKPRTTNV